MINANDPSHRSLDTSYLLVFKVLGFHVLQFPKRPCSILFSKMVKIVYQYGILISIEEDSLSRFPE